MQPTQSTTLTPHEQRRNFALGLANGIIFNVAMVFIDNAMVITWFLTQLDVSNFLIGLMGPMRMIVWYIPQIFASGHLQRQPRKLPAYQNTAIVRVLVILGLAGLVAVIPTDSPWLVIAIFAAFIVYGLLTSVGSLAFMSMLDQVISPSRRGRFFGQRMFWGGIVTLGASSVVGFLLEAPPGLPFPTNYSLIFVISAVTMAIGMGAWCLLKEPLDTSATPHTIHWTEQFKRGMRIFKENGHYRIYVAARLCLILGQVAMPFYIVYAKDVLGISARMVSLYLTARTAASIVSNIFWGRISDRHGNLRLIRITTVIAILTPLMVVLTGVIGRAVPSTLSWLSYAFTLVFIALGAFTSAGVANMNYLLDLAPPSQKPLYLGFTNTLMGVGMITTALGGLIVDWAGFDAVMIIAAGFYVAAIGLSMFMIEPRENSQKSGLRLQKSPTEPN